MVNTFFLSWFILYLFVILGIGVWGWTKIKTQSDFATTNKSLSLVYVWASLFGTYISALSVVGGIGYSSNFGLALMTLFMTGTVGGMAFLALTAKKWHAVDVNSISELMMVRYDSKILRALTACTVVFAFMVILVSQLFGIGFIVEGIIGIPMHLGIIAVGLFFVAYTLLGGMVSVARTDLIQVIVMGGGVLLIAVALLWQIANDPGNSFVQNVDHMTIYNGSTPDNFGLITIFLVFGLGISVHPYFVQRILSAKDVRTARLAPGLVALTAVFFYLALSVIGIIGAIYLPGETGDTMGPAIIREMLGGIVAAIAMMAILAGVQSTTDSLLHVIGVYISQDIFGLYYFDSPDTTTLLRYSRVFTAIFGAIGVSIAAYQAWAGEVGLIALIGAYAWGIIGASLFVVVAAGMFWKRATEKGAIAAVTTGFIGAVGGHELNQAGVIPFDGIILGVVLSVVFMVLVSLLSDPPTREHVAPFFDQINTVSDKSDVEDASIADD